VRAFLFSVPVADAVYGVLLLLVLVVCAVSCVPLAFLSVYINCASVLILVLLFYTKALPHCVLLLVSLAELLWLVLSVVAATRGGGGEGLTESSLCQLSPPLNVLRGPLYHYWRTFDISDLLLSSTSTNNK